MFFISYWNNFSLICLEVGIFEKILLTRIWKTLLDEGQKKGEAQEMMCRISGSFTLTIFLFHKLSIWNFVILLFSFFLLSWLYKSSRMMSIITSQFFILLIQTVMKRKLTGYFYCASKIFFIILTLPFLSTIVFYPAEMKANELLSSKFFLT